MDPAEFAALNARANAYYASQQQPKTATPTKKKKNLLISQLPSALAAAASFVPGVGTVAAAGLGGIGELGRQVLSGEDINGGNIAREAALSAIPGGLGLVAKGAKAAKTAITAGKTARNAESAIKAARTGDEVTQAGRAASRVDTPTSSMDDAVDSIRATAVPIGPKITANNQSMAGRQYAKAFGDIPAKLSRTLKLPQTAQELHDYGVRGSLDDIAGTSNAVMKKLGGAVTGAANDIKGYIKTGDVEGVLSHALKGVNITKGDKDALFSLITDAASKGPMPGYIDPQDALDLVRKLEKRGHDRINSGKNPFNPDDNKVDFGTAHLQAANELEDNLYNAIKGKQSLAPYASPETVAELNGLAKGLGDKFAKAAKNNDAQEVRSLMAPFVRGNHLVQIANDSDNTAFKNLARARGGGGGIIGTAIDAGKAIADPIISRNSATIATNSAGAIDKAKEIAQSAVPIVKGATNYVGRGLAPQLAVRGIVGAGSASEEPPVESPELSAALASANTPDSPDAGTDPSMGGESAAAKISRDQLMQAIAADPKNADTYMSIYKLFADEDAAKAKGSSLTTAQQKAATTAANGKSSLDEIQNALDAAGGAQGKLGGTVANLGARLGLNSNVDTYNQIGTSMAVQLSRALGNTGALSDGDTRMIQAMIPKITDNEETAKAKMQHLASLLAEIQANAGAGTETAEL